VFDGIRAKVGDDLRLRPGLAVVEAALEEQIDVSGVAARLSPSFAEGEQRPLPAGDERGVR